MAIDIDTSEIENLAQGMNFIQQDFSRFLKTFLTRMANEVLRQTKPKTPKDTGALQNAWSLGDIIVKGDEIAVVIRNPMEYATFIEYGHRIVVGSGQNKREVGWYDGVFMLKTSIENVQSKMPEAYSIAFRKFCQSRGF